MLVSKKEWSLICLTSYRYNEHAAGPTGDADAQLPVGSWHKTP
jgi:hypothetical protein